MTLPPVLAHELAAAIGRHPIGRAEVDRFALLAAWLHREANREETDETEQSRALYAASANPNQTRWPS